MSFHIPCNALLSARPKIACMKGKRFSIEKLQLLLGFCCCCCCFRAFSLSWCYLSVHAPCNPSTWKGKWEDQKFMNNFGSVVSMRSVWTTWDPVSEK